MFVVTRTCGHARLWDGRSNCETGLNAGWSCPLLKHSCTAVGQWPHAAGTAIGEAG